MNFSASSHLRLCSISLATLIVTIVGCSASLPSNSPVAGGQLRGNIHGGNQPVSGANVQLYAAGTTGYGVAATALLASPVVTDARGNFTITGDYTCPSSSSQLYIVATGGNPGLAPGTNNSALAMMTALGRCSLHGSQYTLDPNEFIWINEVTTVASVYALAAFMGGDATHVGSSSTNAIGLANSFQIVNNLVNTTSGAALSVTPAGNGTAPQATIDTLGNILSTCMNSDGTGTPCSALFAAATPSGGATPTDTIQAIYNIARNPSNNVSALYELSPATGAPFQPTLSSAPNDWTIHVTYTAYGAYQSGIAVDGSGNVWIANESPASVTELTTDGTILSGPAGYTGGGLSTSSVPSAIAIDPLGNAWLTNTFGGLAKFNNVGIPLSGSTGFPVPCGGLAIDGFGNVWCGGGGQVSHVSKIDNNGNLLSGTGYTGGGLGAVINASVDPLNNVWFTVTTGASNVGNVAKFTNVGVPLSGTTGYTAPGLNQALGIANDGAGNTWVTNNGIVSSVFRFAADGTNLSGPNGYTGGGLTYPLAIAIDGAGNAWVTSGTTPFSGPPVPYSVVQFGPDGTLLSGATGYSLSTNGIAGAYPAGIAIDGSGNVWVASSRTNILELVGAATPVVTPLSVGVKNKTLGTRP